MSQRWLLKFWTQHLNSQHVPRWQAVEAERLSSMQENLSFLDIVRSANGGLRFVVRFHGQMIQRAYGSPDGRGRYLDEIVPPGACPTGLAPYEKAANDGLPIYTILDVTDRQGRLVHAERLILPFSRDGKTVDRLLAAFEFFCADGAFDSHALMQLAAQPALRLSVRIEARV